LVAIAVVSISSAVALCSCEQYAPAQQPDFAHYEAGIGWRGCKPIDRGLCSLDISFAATLQQRFHQDRSR
jgi:hypothetical protein